MDSDGHRPFSVARADGKVVETGDEVQAPHFYTEQVDQLPYEEIAAAGELTIKGSTDIASFNPNGGYVNDIEYAEPTPLPQTPPNPHRRPNARRRVHHESDDDKVAGENRDHQYHQNEQGDVTDPDLAAQYPEFAYQIAERNRTLDPDGFQIPNRDPNHNTLLPAITFAPKRKRQSDDDLENKPRQKFHDGLNRNTTYEKNRLPQSSRNSLQDSLPLPAIFRQPNSKQNPVKEHSDAVDESTHSPSNVSQWLEVYQHYVDPLFDVANESADSLTRMAAEIGDEFQRSDDQEYPVNPTHAGMSNRKMLALGREYLLLKYSGTDPEIPYDDLLQFYKECQEVGRTLGPGLTLWLEYMAEKRGIFKTGEAVELMDQELIEYDTFSELSTDEFNKLVDDMPDQDPATPRIFIQSTSLMSGTSIQTENGALRELEEEDEVDLIPTSPKSIAAKLPAKTLSTAEGLTTDAEDQTRGNNDASTIMTTTKKNNTPTGVKRTKAIFDAVKAQSLSRDQDNLISRTSSPAPESAAWSWGKAIDSNRERSYRAIISNISAGPGVSGLRHFDNSNVIQGDQSSSNGGIIHSREPHSSSTRARSLPKKPLHSEQPPLGHHSLDSTVTQANSEHRGVSTSGKPNSRPPTSPTTRASPPSQDQSPPQRIDAFTTPKTRHNTFAESSPAPAPSRLRPYQPSRSVDYSTMSTPTTPTNGGFMGGQQQIPTRQDNSPTPSGYGGGMSGASIPHRPTAPSGINSREFAYADFPTSLERKQAIAKFNCRAAEKPDKYKNLAITEDLKPESTMLEVSGPLGSNVRGSMREIFPGYRINARIG